MTLDADSRFDLNAYVKLVESLWDGHISQLTFEREACALGADANTIAVVISNMRAMDGIQENDHA